MSKFTHATLGNFVMEWECEMKWEGGGGGLSDCWDGGVMGNVPTIYPPISNTHRVWRAGILVIKGSVY